MSIKKSILEQNLLYRVAKVIFLTLPFLAGGVLFLKGYIDIPVITQKNISDVLQKNSTELIYVAIGLVAYYLILNIIWRGFLYIAFGGLEDDIKPKVIAAVPPAGQIGQPIIPQDSSVAVVNYLKEAERKKSEAVTWIILIIIFIWIAVYYSTPSSSTSGGGGSKTKITNTSTCIPTGCGSNWHCSGSYYSSSGAQKSISGCYADKTSVTSLNSWSGICRQCP